MASSVVGYKWGRSGIDPDGHRTWSLAFLVQVDTHADGPAVAVQTPGLPIEGDVYSVGNDLDIWAWCRSGPTSIAPVTEKGNLFFLITYTFSTRPPDASGPGGSAGGGRDDRGSRKKCADQRIEDPLSEPPATSGNSSRYTKHEDFDIDGKPFLYTSGEEMHGQAREFDRHREQVIIEQNVINLERGLILSLLNKVNDEPLWDMPARCWKLQDWSWSRKLYGTCGFYYTRRLIFECDALEVPDDSPLFVSTQAGFLVQGPDGRWWIPNWDKYVLDESNKVLNGHWNWLTGAWVLDNINGAAPVSTNPSHYIQAHDRAHNPIRVILSDATPGVPATNANDFNYIRNRKYLEGDMLQLGIPTELD